MVARWLSVALVALAVAIGEASASQFVLGGAGAAFSYAPAGYVAATVADLRSSAFLQSYNANGLRDLGERMPADWCPFIAVREGIVALNAGGAVQLFAPFGTNQKYQSGRTLVNPVWFGDLSGPGWAQQQFIGSLSAAKAQALTAVGPPLSLRCNYSHAHFMIYTKAQFVLGGYGSGFPSMPRPHAVLATVADVRSQSFVDQYNANGLPVDATAEALPSPGCCVIRVADDDGAYLAVSNSFLGPWLLNGSSQCPNGVNPAFTPLVSPMWFGTGPWGVYANELVGQLNFTSETELNAISQLPYNCSEAEDAWALYKVHPHSAPPGDGDCFEVSLQAAYYEPASGVNVCLAYRRRFYMRLNETYASVSMSSLIGCSGARSLFGMEIYPYNATWLVATTTGATGCDCSNGTYNNQALLPMNATGWMDYTTVCYVPQPSYGFCKVEIAVTGGPMKCP